MTEPSADALGGRVPAVPGEAETLAILTREFAAAGLTPAGTAGTWLQPVPLSNNLNPSDDTRFRYNVVGRLSGTDPPPGRCG